MKTLILIISFLFLGKAELLNAQAIQEWAKTFNGSGNNQDQAAAIVHDGFGNVIVTGRAISTGNNTDFGTVKYNSAGVQQWAITYNGTGNSYDEAFGLATDNSGNVYVTGQSLNASSNYDIVLVKYDQNGAQLWVREWNGSGSRDDVPNDITADGLGNTYITGYTELTSSNVNYITLKYNSAGVLQWAKEYNNPINSYDAAYYVDADEIGNVYVTGTSNSQATGSDFLTIKYNSNGDSLWVTRYGVVTLFNEIPQGFAVDQNGNVYVTGFSQGPSNSIDFATIKYNSNGVQQWVAIYDTTGQQDIPEDLEVDSDGNVYVTGRSRVSSSYNDFATIKYNADGVRQWIAIYDNAPESRDDYGYDLILDEQGNVYVTGNSQESGTNRDALTIKYDNSGVQKWVARYDVSNSEEAYAITLDDNNNVYVTGYQTGSNSDFLTIKYSQSVGIHQTSGSVPEGFVLKQNYPNPFNPVTNLEFGISKLGFVSLKVYDVRGNEVATLVKENLPAGVYKVDFNGSTFTSGVYFYRLIAEGFNETKKMILTK